MRRGDPLAAIKWAAEFPNAATRGSRVVAVAVVLLGRSSFDGVTSLAAVAAMTGCPLPTLYKQIEELDHRFGLVEPGRDAMKREIRENIDDLSGVLESGYKGGDDESDK